MFRGECKIPNCYWIGQYWLFDSYAKDEAVWHTYDAHQEEWRTVIGDRPPRNARPTDIKPIKENLR